MAYCISCSSNTLATRDAAHLNSTLRARILTARMKVVVIIPAARLGARMTPMPPGDKGKHKTPSKQFTEQGGTPILIHTLRKFAAVDVVSEIWIALRENEIQGFRERLEGGAKDVLRKKVEIVAGGEHRQQSVENALNAISA